MINTNDITAWPSPFCVPLAQALGQLASHNALLILLYVRPLYLSSLLVIVLTTANTQYTGTSPHDVQPGFCLD